VIAAAISSGAAGRPAGARAASWSSWSPITSVPSVRVGPLAVALDAMIDRIQALAEHAAAARA
jgi:hypothetical protein